MVNVEPPNPGLIVMFGSGETAPSSQKVYDWLFNKLPKPVQVAILETPAGFQLNSALVAEKISEFLSHHLQNYHPEISIIPARKKDTLFSPDDEEIASKMLTTNVMLMGPGSPTYAYRNLKNTLAWNTLVAKHRQGSALVLASAAVITAGKYLLPIYEIYKAGDDLHWREGLDLFGPYGLSLVFVSHLNNREGGDEFDTSYCYMGLERFNTLYAMLPPDVNVVGIDEHTALIINLDEETCSVIGNGTVALIRQGQETRYKDREIFNISELGDYNKIDPGEGIPPDVWETVLEALEKEREAANLSPTEQVLALVQDRERARTSGDWNSADLLRQQIQEMGWQVNDTEDGPEIKPFDK
ncbi:MAG TPA: cysteinyl-tRNA synthetase [Dehalococcoidia bacterium]|nr:cysteinyl-tRNA synthetase [Dehalococcoidia bacterium]